MKSEGWKTRVVCVGYMEKREEEETKSREKKRERDEREREQEGLPVLFFSFLFRLGRRKLRKGGTRTLPYRMVMLLSLLRPSPLIAVVWHCTVLSSIPTPCSVAVRR